MISIVMICETEWMIVMRVVAEMDFRDRVVGSRENVIELEISTWDTQVCHINLLDGLQLHW